MRNMFDKGGTTVVKSAYMNGRVPLQTVDQALALLGDLAISGTPRTLTALAREHGTSKARMHRLLAALKERGFVSQDDETHRYSFGPACMVLSEQWRRKISAGEVCLPVARALSERTEETILLAVHQDGRAVVVEKIDSPRPVLARSQLGAVLPLHAVSTGKVLLASRPDAEIERLIARGLPRYTRGTCVDPAKLWTEIRRIRRVGFAVNCEGYRPGVSGVAAAVLSSPTGPVVAALGVCVPSVRFAADFISLRDQVLEAAARASELLSGTLVPGSGWGAAA